MPLEVAFSVGPLHMLPLIYHLTCTRTYKLTHIHNCTRIHTCRPTHDTANTARAASATTSCICRALTFSIDVALTVGGTYVLPIDRPPEHRAPGKRGKDVAKSARALRHCQRCGSADCAGVKVAPAAPKGVQTQTSRRVQARADDDLKLDVLPAHMLYIRVIKG